MSSRQQWIGWTLLAVVFWLSSMVGIKAEAAGQPVQLHVDGYKAQLDNGILRVSFKENATVDSLVKNNVELAHNIVQGKDTFYLDYNAERKGQPFVVDELRVITNTTDEAHIAYIDKTSMLYAEYHIILKKGESGLHCYVIVKNNLGREFTLSELRTVYRLDPGIFDHAYNAERKGPQPLNSHLKQYKRIQDETYEIPDGEKYTNGTIYSKYDFAGYYKDNPFWGQYGNGFGFWFIPVSTEYYPGGPLKQDLLVHYDTITLNYMTGAHFGTGDFAVPVDWQKIYGPWYIYINTGDEDTVINDAAKQAQAEMKKWPYKWMDEVLYPVQRSKVSGKLVMTGNRSAANAMVVLAKPGGDFIRQTSDYIFSAAADKNGKFSIRNVRPGEYDLYAYATNGDVTQQLEKDHIVVGSEDVDLKDVTWNPPIYKNKLWQIGFSDRTAQEFKYGGELRNYKWQTMIPENLDFYIGKSNSQEDWYYAQTKTGDWNVHFDLKDTIAKKYNLTVAMAAFSKGKMSSGSSYDLTIKVNGQSVKTVSYPNDTTIYRSATKSGWYHLENIEIDASLLKCGENVITFANHGSAIMYDTILLESNG